MWKYVVKRIALAIVTIFIIITITFFAMNAIPGGPFQKEKSPLPAVQAVLEERFNLDKPLIVQFGLYLRNMFRGDFGISLKTGREISAIIGESFAISAKIGAAAIITALLPGLIFGSAAALMRNKWPDRLIIFSSTVFVSVPSFVLATILLLVFSLKLGWVPVWSIKNPSYILPIVALALYPMSYITRLTKSSMLDVLNQDYIRTAYAKGLSKRTVILKHGLRNALNPVITAITGWFAELLAGAFFVEYIFGWQGIGKVTVDALEKLDYPVVMGSVLVAATFFIIINILADILYGVVDPRVRVE